MEMKNIRPVKKMRYTLDRNVSSDMFILNSAISLLSESKRNKARIRNFLKQYLHIEDDFNLDNEICMITIENSVENHEIIVCEFPVLATQNLQYEIKFNSVLDISMIPLTKNNLSLVETNMKGLN